MSQQNESDSLSLPTLHFIENSAKTEKLTVPNIENDAPSVDVEQIQQSTVNNDTTEQTPKTNDDEKPIKTASHSRRVHFPNDDSQLCVVSYAPEPLSNQPLLSLGVILQRYRATCQRLQQRPLNCLFNQLSMMDDGRKSFYDRLDCLKIVNEKIDLKHIDALEEIFSRCRFHTLDLESATIDDAALIQLFEVMEYYESCTHLNLSGHRSIGYLGYQALTKYLRKTNCLERLDVNSIRFDENNVLSLTRALRLSSTLYELHIESCQLNGKILQKFIQNFRSCSSLRELYLCDNRIQAQDSLLINELIRISGSFLSLLDLRSNNLQDTGMSHIASQLSQYDENHAHENHLHKISFQSNQLTQQGIGFLAKSLLHNRTIRSLNLSNNNITNEGFFFLRDALLTNRTINELILRNCRLTDQAAIALAEFIAESATIQYIDLRENTIQASGVCGMAIAIRNNKSLLKLDFDPIVSTPTNLNFLSNNNSNIDRKTNSNSLLSLANLRKMTTGFSSFTTTTPLNSSVTGGGGTRELLEQKARWMNDIAAVCQRNILIYEEKLRLAEAEEQQQTNQENHSNVVQPEDIELKEQINDNNQTEINSSSETFDNEKSQQEKDTSVEEKEQSVDITNNDEKNIEQNEEIKSVLVNSTNNNENDEIEPTINDSPKNENNEIKSTIDDSSEIDNNEIEQTINDSTKNENNETKPPINDSMKNASNEIEQPIINSTNDIETIERINDTSVNTEETTTDNIERILNGDNPNEPESDIILEKSTFPESSSNSDLTDDILDDDKRKIHHSDSIYLIRKKVKSEKDDTSDDESQLSSLVEQ